MNHFTIKTASTFNDAIIISQHITDIWKDEVDHDYYTKMYNHITKFRQGYLIGYLANEPVSSSLAFPIGRIPSFNEINQGNIFDFFDKNSKYYYIHIIQVIEAVRNKGFGIKLLRHQINTARKYKYQEIIGMSIDRELPLWKKCGFKDFGEFGIYKHYGRMKWVRMSTPPICKNK